MTDAPAGQGPFGWPGRFWRGELPLSEAFWTGALTIGLAVNVTTSLLFLGLITADLPWLALIMGYGISLPYNALAVVGVWRSAARYSGPSLHANLARLVTVTLMAGLTLT